jgi:hypothetical protein
MAKIIAKLQREEYTNGTKYSIGYLIHANELFTYDVAINSNASGWTGVSGTYVTRKVIKYYPPNYKVFYESVTADSTGFSGAIKTTKTLKSFDVGQYMMDPSFWGIHEASQTDVTNAIFNIKGSACSLKDYIFPGATDSSIGTPVYSRSPFDNLSSAISADSVYAFAGHKVPVTTYTVNFSTTKDINSFETWRGVNGSFGSGMNPNTTTSKAWISIGQTVEEGADSKRVARKMLLAPYILGTQLLWDSTIVGTWTW